MKLTGSRCQCAACGEYFNSTGMFDRHRTGAYSDFGAHRRCLTASEMLAKGYLKNAAGFWIRQANRRRTDSSGDLPSPLPVSRPGTPSAVLAPSGALP
jgi:hypothetical protein